MTTEISELEASTKRTSPPTDTFVLEKPPTMTTNGAAPLDHQGDTESSSSSSSSSNDNDDDESHSEELEDAFDMSDIKEPRLSSSTVPIVVQVSNAHKTARFYQNDADPLFQGVCLYSTATSSKNDVSETKQPPLFRPRADNDTSDSPESLDLWDQWYMPSAVFRYLWRRGSRIQMDKE